MRESKEELNYVKIFRVAKCSLKMSDDQCYHYRDFGEVSFVYRVNKKSGLG
jgi:hypothetical protein